MRRRVPILLILVIGMTLRLWGLGFGLPHTFARPDEDAVMSIALRVFQRHLNPEFFDWPSLFMYVVAAGFVVYFNLGRLAHVFPYEISFISAASTNPTPLHLIARGLSAVAGVFTIASMHRMGTLFFDARTALIGALFLAVAPLHVRDSHFGVTDIAATFLLAESFVFTLKATKSGSTPHLLASGLLAGLAASTKYNAGLIAVTGVWAVLSGQVGQRHGWTSRVRLVGLYGATALVAFIVGTPFSVLDPSRFVSALEGVSEHLRSGHAAFAGYGWQVHLTSSLRYGLGQPMLIAGIVGLLLMFRREWRAGVLFTIFPLTYYALIGSGQTTFARYILPIIPFVCLAAAHATSELARWLVRQLEWPHGVSSVAWTMAIVIAVPSAWSSVRTDMLLARTDNRLLAAQWIHEDLAPLGARISQSGATYAWVQMQTSDPLAREHYPEVTFDAATKQFVDADRTSTAPPDLIVVPQCPLAYCTVPDDLRSIVERDYRLAKTFDATDLTNPALVYDRDDAFFLPLAGFSAVTRPGPNLAIYMRRDAAQ